MHAHWLVHAAAAAAAPPPPAHDAGWSVTQAPSPRTTRRLPSAEFYEKVSTSRTYADRLATIDNVRQAGISVCAGGIIGLGEATMDRVGLLHQVGGCCGRALCRTAGP